MSKFGWSLPAGCSTSDLPGNSPEEEKAAALLDTICDLLSLHNVPEESLLAISDTLLKLISATYSDGYQQGQADASLALEEYTSSKESYNA